MNIDLGGLLQQVLGNDAQNVPDQFHQAAQAAPTDLLSQGLTAMFRSDQTPAFGQMVGQLFGQANTDQQAGMLTQLIAGMGPGVLASLTGSAGGSGLGAILGRLTEGGSAAVTPDVVAQLSTDQLQQIANHAEQHSPGIVDRMSAFYAEHPGLVKTLGSAALSIALAEMAGRQRAA
jgi:hypothetical protein